MIRRMPVQERSEETERELFERYAQTRDSALRNEIVSRYQIGRAHV